MFRTQIRIALLLMIITTLVMGCAPQVAVPTGSEDTQAAEPASGERPVIELLLNTGDQLPPDDRNFIKQALDEALGIDLRLVGFASDDDLRTQLNVRMAAGNAPDLIRVTRATMSEYAQKGMLLDLTPYAAELEGVKSLVGEDALTKGMIGETLYAIPRTPDPLYHTYWIRTDWLENLGLEMPETLEELREVLVAFREQDPDGNGNKDTYGLTGQSLSTFGPIFAAFGVTAPASAWGTGSPDALYLEDGQLVNGLNDPDMAAALEYIRQLIADDLVDPEWPANTGLRHQEKAFQGVAGVVYAHWAHMARANFIEQYKAINPDAE
jgi:putative aldouronate transport system substrate-binding protein